LTRKVTLFGKNIKDTFNSADHRDSSFLSLEASHQGRISR